MKISILAIILFFFVGVIGTLGLLFALYRTLLIVKGAM